MTIQIDSGTRLGPYEIVSRIGAGGMGEVWRARDTRLDRQVAIKVLPVALAQNEQFRARFEREAKTISQLNHPNICTLHDIGYENGTSYLVMESLEGESLADRLARGPLPLTEVLRYGAQVAAALDRAHRAGIVHRDLKPGNVVITKSGAKLLDFGLAKSSASPITVSIDGATEHRPLTQEGTILGTFQYMAPEQLEGQEADPRTDIFAFGALLYEMTTGRRAFEGKTKTSLIASIVDRDPIPVSQLQALTPPALEHTIAKCLSKDPDDRWQSAHDVAEQLTWIGEAGSQAGVATPIIRRRRRSRAILLASVAALIGAAIAIAAGYAFITARQTPLRFTISMPEALRLAGPESGGGVAVAPNGRSIIFVGQDATSTKRLYWRSLDSFDPKPIPFTEGATYPFWSPDGQAIAFFSDGKVKRVGLLGSPSAVIGDAPDARGGSWSKDGTIIYAATTSSALTAIGASGGAPHPATQMMPGDGTHRFPSFFPDGDHFVYFKQGAPATQGVWIASLSSKATARLIGARLAAVACDEEEIAYVRDGVLLIQHVDFKRLSLTGEPRPVAQNLTLTSGRNTQLLSLLPRIAVFQTGGTGLSTFKWFDRAGANLGTVGAPDEFTEPTFSARESKVVVTVADNGVCEVDLKSGRVIRFQSFPNEQYITAAAAPDGSTVISAAIVNGKQTLVEFLPGRQRKVVAEFKKDKWPDYFDRRGQTLLLDGAREDGRGDNDVYMAQRSNGFKLEALLDSPANESKAQLSLDGKLVAYSSDESGRAEVYVQPVPPTGAKWQVSTAGGGQAQWRGDGKEIFYLSPDAKIMSVPVKSLAPFEAGEPATLFATHLEATSVVGVLGDRNQYLVTGDGQRFLLLEPVQSPHANELSVITNWKR